MFKVFLCVRKCHKWPASRHTPQPGLPVWQRVQQRAWSFAALPQGLLCKSSICRVANARRAGSPFVLCFVLCALQLLPLQSSAHDVKTLNSLSCTPAKKKAQPLKGLGFGRHEPPTGLVHQGCAGCGAAPSRAAGDVADGETVGAAADSAAAAGAVQPPPSAL